jgi:hypothetical protein
MTGKLPINSMSLNFLQKENVTAGVGLFAFSCTYSKYVVCMRTRAFSPPDCEKIVAGMPSVRMYDFLDVCPNGWSCFIDIWYWRCVVDLMTPQAPTVRALNVIAPRRAAPVMSGKRGPALVADWLLKERTDGTGKFRNPRLAPRRMRQIDCCAEDDVAGE